MPDLQRYLDLIPPPNNYKPNFMSTIQFIIQPIVDIQTINNTLFNYFDLNTAIGIQLDILGQILGLSRIVPFEPSDSSSPVLSDDNYRIVLQAKIIQNQWKGTKGEIYEFWNQHFPSIPIIIKDNQDMTMDVQVTGMAAGIQQDLVTKGYFMPKPAGVRINGTFIVPTSGGGNITFAWNLEDANFDGWNIGLWQGLP